MECMCGEVFDRKYAKDHKCLYCLKKFMDKRKKDLTVMQQQGKMKEKTMQKALEIEHKTLTEDIANMQNSVVSIKH